MEKVFVVTGASRGLGFAVARELCRDPVNRVILAVRDPGRGAEAARRLGPRAEVRRLDLASLEDVDRFAKEWTGPLAGLVNNAGVQHPAGTHRTADGWEETIAVNHLAALALTVKLLPALQGGRVLFIGSATHDPSDRLTRALGFRGARFTSIAALARGEGDGATARQLGLDRYATSKFLNTATAAELARRIPPERTAFFTLDPGMMPGTGLVRTAPMWTRALWSTVLRWIGPLLPGTSSPARSARTAAAILCTPFPEGSSGTVIGFDGRPARVWPPTLAPETGRTVVDESLDLLGLRLAGEGGTWCSLPA